jgi:tetratricopeptide (TPR) repeat protein
VKKNIVVILLLLAAAAVIFIAGAPSTEGPFYLDSEAYFRSLPYFQERSLSWEKVGDIIFRNPYPGGKRFLPNLTFIVENNLAGFTPSSGRYVNMAIHVLNFFLVYLLLRKVLRLIGRSEKASTKGALIGSLLWGLNPFMTDAVYYVIQRMTLMSATFYLLAVLCYMKAREASGLTRWGWGAALALSYAGSIASKESGALIILGIIVLELTIYSKDDTAPGAWKKYLQLIAAFTACSLLAMGILGYNPISIVKGLFSFNQGREFTVGERLLTEGRVLVHYLSLEIFPLPERLSFVLKYRISRSLLHPPTTILAWMAVFGLVFVAIRERKRKPLISLAILWFFANHILESTILMLEIAFVHRNYLPTVFLFLPLGAWVASHENENRWPRHVALSCVFLVLMMFAYGTHARARIWGEPEDFWQDAIRKAPRSLKGYINLGILHDVSGRDKEAIQIYERGLRSGFEEKPGFWGDVYCNIGIALMDLGRYKEAEPYMDKALSITKNEDYLFNMATLQRFLKKPQKGLAFLSILEERNPYYHGLHLSKAKLLSEMGRHEAARQELLRELELYPNNQEARMLLFNYGVR